MKKLLFTLLFALPVMAMAQTASDVNFTASAAVANALALENDADLAFGNIPLTNEDAVVDANPTNAANNNVGVFSRAEIRVAQGQGQVSFSINDGDNTVTMNETGTGIETLDLVLSYFINGAGYTNESAVQVETDDVLYIGGTITAAQLNGKGGLNFQATITVEASYF